MESCMKGEAYVMKSKYPLDPEFSDIKDQTSNNSSRFMLDLGNILLKIQAKQAKADGVSVTQEDIKIPGYKGKMIKARVFSPASADGKLPCIVNFHGGAFVGTGMRHQLRYCINFAQYSMCKVIFVDYRLALRHPFPVPVEDCYAALVWTYCNAEKLGIDRERIAVFGDSAGGALAAAVCQMARDRKTDIPCFQMLIYPVTDSTQTSESVKRCTDTPQFNSVGNAAMWKYYLADGDHGMPQYAAPLLASDFSRLPPAYIETAEFDCLHDEGVAYGEKLRAEGIDVEIYETRGSYHGFDIQEDREYSKRMLKYRCEVMKRVFYGK